MSNDALIIKNMDLSHIHLSVHQVKMYFHPKTMLPEDIGLECLGYITLQPNVSLALEDGS